MSLSRLVLRAGYGIRLYLFLIIAFLSTFHVLLNLLNESGKDKMRGCAEHLIDSPNEFDKFNNTGARMQDSIYHMPLKLHYIRQDFPIRKRHVFIDVNP